MFQAWRVKLREAELAFQRGQLDEATRLLCHEDLRDFLPAKRLLDRVAGRIAERGEAHLNSGQSLAGWRDMEAAARLGADAKRLAKLREEMVTQMLGEVQVYLAAGDYRAALARLDELERRRITSADTRRLRGVADKMATGQRLMRRGQFTAAESELQIAAQLAGDLTVVASWLADCKMKGNRLRDLEHQLHESLATENWQRVLDHADAILELAPDDPPARAARARAWQAVGMRVGDTSLSASPLAVVASRPMSGDAMTLDRPRGDRYLLWVDSVGGFLICLGDEVSLGQPVQGNPVDIPLLADLSRVQARIRRDGEGYLLDPVRTTRLANQLVTELVPLNDSAVIELGSSVKLRFRQPHALSATARLDFVSRHRSQPAADAVVLMGESCVLGPKPGNHIVCPDWTREVVLYRHGDELYCRAPGPFTVDGVEHHDRARLERNSTVSGADFSFTLEAI